LLTHGGQGVLDIPPTRTLEGMTPDLCPRQVTSLGRGQEADYSVTNAVFTHSGFPNAIINVPRGTFGFVEFLVQFVQEGTLGLK